MAQQTYSTEYFYTRPKQFLKASVKLKELEITSANQINQDVTREIHKVLANGRPTLQTLKLLQKNITILLPELISNDNLNSKNPLNALAFLIFYFCNLDLKYLTFKRSNCSLFKANHIFFQIFNFECNDNISKKFKNILNTTGFVDNIKFVKSFREKVKAGKKELKNVVASYLGLRQEGSSTSTSTSSDGDVDDAPVHRAFFIRVF